MINQIFKGIEIEIIQQEYFGEYTEIEYNSLNIINNGIFVALEGTNTDGHIYIKSAIKKGAKLIVVNKKNNELYKGINIIKVNDTRKILGQLASNFYGHPENHLKLIGVTGTNGKTTTSYLIHNFLDSSAFIGSIGVKIGDKNYPPVNTTPESLDIIKYALEAKKANLKYLILEVSSQGIDNWRVEGLEFDGAIFTNLTKEHLDYHKDMEEYFSVKERLFKQLKKDGIGLVCIDDEYGKRLKNSYNNIYTYGNSTGDYHGKIKSISFEKMDIEVKGPKRSYSLETSLIGQYNFLNILAAIGLVEKLEENTLNLNEKLKTLSFVEGRMQIIEKNGIKVIVDYAHTEDALEKVLISLRSCKPKRIFTMISGTGERYREKRPVLGRIAALYSDYIMISSNSPRGEDPYNIANEVARGVEEAGFKNYKIEIDRNKAIEKMINDAESGDVLILTGKGHERYQEIKGIKYKHSEVEAVKKAFDLK